MRQHLLHTPEGVRDIYNEECEKKFDFNQGEPYVPEEGEGSAKSQLKRILISCGCAAGLILFLIWVIPFLMSLFGVRPV